MFQTKLPLKLFLFFAFNSSYTCILLIYLSKHKRQCLYDLIWSVSFYWLCQLWQQPQVSSVSDNWQIYIAFEKSLATRLCRTVLVMPQWMFLTGWKACQSISVELKSVLSFFFKNPSEPSFLSFLCVATWFSHNSKSSNNWSGKAATDFHTINSIFSAYSSFSWRPDMQQHALFPKGFSRVSQVHRILNWRVQDTSFRKY